MVTIPPTITAEAVAHFGETDKITIDNFDTQLKHAYIASTHMWLACFVCLGQS